MDFYHDSVYSSLKEISEKTEIPSWVKEASLSTPEILDVLPNRSFGWQEKRLFPLHTKTDTWLSSAYCLNKKAEVPKQVYESIVKAAFVYKLEDALKTLFMDLVPQKKASIYALDTEFSGKPLKKYIIDTSEHIKQAQQYFEQNYSKYPFNWRTQIASNIIKRANELKSEVFSPAVLTYGEVCPVDREKAAFNVAARSLLIKDPTMGHVLCKVAQSLLTEEVDPKLLLSVITNVDTMEKLASHYDKQFKDPWQSIFGKTAVLSLSNWKGNQILWNNAAEKLSYDDLVPTMGKNTASQMTSENKQLDPLKAKAYFEQKMPADQKALFAQTLAQKLS